MSITPPTLGDIKIAVCKYKYGNLKLKLRFLLKNDENKMHVFKINHIILYQ